MAKDCVKLIYVLSYVVVANLLLLIALSAISAALPVIYCTGRKLFQQSFNAEVFIKCCLFLDLLKMIPVGHCSQLIKGACPGFRLVCGFTSKTSNQQLLSTNGIKPQEGSSKVLQTWTRSSLSRLLLFPLNYLHCLPFFSSLLASRHTPSDRLSVCFPWGWAWTLWFTLM